MAFADYNPECATCGHTHPYCTCGTHVDPKPRGTRVARNPDPKMFPAGVRCAVCGKLAVTSRWSSTGEQLCSDCYRKRTMTRGGLLSVRSSHDKRAPHLSLCEVCGYPLGYCTVVKCRMHSDHSGGRCETCCTHPDWLDKRIS